MNPNRKVKSVLCRNIWQYLSNH